MSYNPNTLLQFRLYVFSLIYTVLKSVIILIILVLLNKLNSAVYSKDIIIIKNQVFIYQLFVTFWNVLPQASRVPLGSQLPLSSRLLACAFSTLQPRSLYISYYLPVLLFSSDKALEHQYIDSTLDSSSSPHKPNVCTNHYATLVYYIY